MVSSPAKPWCCVKRLYSINEYLEQRVPLELCGFRDEILTLC